MKLTLAAGLVLLVLSSCSLDPVYAQDACLTVEQDRAIAERNGVTWLGIVDMPFTDDSFVLYTKDGRVMVSSLIDGCVDAHAPYVFGRFKPDDDQGHPAPQNTSQDLRV